MLSADQAETFVTGSTGGGTLISSHRCGLLDESHKPRENFALADVFGVDYVSRRDEIRLRCNGKQREGNAISTYLESTGHPLAAAIAQGSVGCPDPSSE